MLAILLLGLVAQDGDSAPSFEREIRPLLMARCSGCHQPALLKGGLDLTSYAALMAGADGDHILNFGRPEESVLLESVTSMEDLAPDMPPEGPALDALELSLLRRWIDAGAPDDTLNEGPRWTVSSPPIYNRAPVIASISHSPDGRWLAVSGMQETLVYSTDDLKLAKRLVGLSERITSVCFSPDSLSLAVAGGTPAISGELQLWDVESGTLKWSKAVTHDTIRGVSFSPDGALIACGGTDNTLRAVKTENGEQVLYQSSHTDWVLATAWSSDGSHLLSVGRDRSLKLVKVETQQFIDNVTSITPGALRGGLLAVKRHPKEELVLVGGADGAPQLFKIFREKKRVIGDNYNLIRSFEPLPGRVYDLAWAPNAETIVAVSSTGKVGWIRAYNSADGVARWSHKQAAGQFTTSIHPSGERAVCAGADGTLRRYQLSDGALIDELLVQPGRSGK